MKNIFPKAVNPPQLVKPYAPVLGYVTSGIVIVLAVLHLFRIDTLLPIVDKVLPNDSTVAGAFVIVVILAEIFALPFLLRVNLSPLAHITSGLLAVLAPLMWSLLSIWAFGLPYSTGELGEFVTLKSTWWLVVLNLIWLSFNFFTLWTLGYNNLKVKDVLRK